MARFILVAAFLIATPDVHSAGRQDTDETKRLRERVELLETKLKLAERENELLKRELELLKKGGGSQPKAGDGFGVGTKLVGTLTRSWVANRKQLVDGANVEFEVTRRSGKEFTAQLWTHNRKDGFEVEGTIENNLVRFSSTKSLTDSTANVIGLHMFTGRLEKGVLTGRTTKKGDTTYRGDWKLSPKKD